MQKHERKVRANALSKPVKACLLLCVQWHNSEKSISDEFFARLNVARTLAAILSTFDFCVIPNLMSYNRFFFSLYVCLSHSRSVDRSRFAYQRSTIANKTNDTINLSQAFKMLDFKLNYFWHFLDDHKWRFHTQTHKYNNKWDFDL